MSQPSPGFKIGSIPVEVPLLLAPMEDVTNLPFRLIAKRIAQPGLMFTEFVSAMAIHYGATKTFRKMRIHPGERPMGIQIFGGEPDVMAETARIAEEMGADIVDINMGCWVPKVCKTGSGAALLKDPELAERIVASVVKAVKVPVTVKVRAGWDYSLFAAPDLARRFQDAGARMITLHARFAKQGFEGEADWKLISDMREAVRVPLIGNGDVKKPEDALKMLTETGCDGVMVGRAAISNPWALRDIQRAMTGQDPMPAPTLAERIRVATEHLRMMVACEADAESFEEARSNPAFADAEFRACRALRGQIPLYIKGEVGASQIRDRLTRCSTVAEFETVLDEFAAQTAAR
ncbi:tRNA dihydrouridine synthase DusB [Fimbriimonas ginsengisoli]|uniref:tRNA-dihydrouridine synthase n=1 Tax=Fimbriimonas ginsengisoli Gsoil 348 TaxID=661478 RepID=A0A068NV80_FIMGI|nr:tRNA dihydrouridine synthase DusB [Fimbriimonas ginsengisoli]AIE87356.1 putative TIM-barrel protein, nifR3 family [Fimbriimonas ginsengisoli Gsoil 348]